MAEGVGVPWGHQYDGSGRSEKKGITCTRLNFFDEAPLGLEASGVSVEHRASHVCCCFGGIHSYLGGCCATDNAVAVRGGEINGDHS